MMKPIKLLTALTAVLAFLVLSGCLQPDNNGGNGNVDNSQWPDFPTYRKSLIEPVFEDGKPVVLVFSTTSCPHCSWIKETYDGVLKEYLAEGKIVARHWELDIGDDSLTDEVEAIYSPEDFTVYQQFNERGSVPTFIISQKYYRIGSGYEHGSSYKGLTGLEAEAQELRDILDELINTS